MACVSQHQLRPFNRSCSDARSTILFDAAWCYPDEPRLDDGSGAGSSPVSKVPGIQDVEEEEEAICMVSIRST